MIHNSVRRSAVAALLLAVLGTLAACGVPTDPAPQPVSSAEIAQAGDVAAQTTTSTAAPTPTPSSSVTEQADVYFVRGDRLTDVKRTVALSAVPAPALAALLAGPTAEEAAAGIQTAIPSGTPPLDVTVVGGVAVVTVPSTFSGLSAQDQILAVAELVYTLTGVEGVSGMQMTDGDQIVAVPTPRGQLLQGPVAREDFAALAPQ